MFRNLTLGYVILIALTLIAIGTAAALGVAPILSYIDPRTVTKMFPIWFLVPLLWLGRLAVEMTLRRTDRPFVAIWRMLFQHRHWLLRGTFFVALCLFMAKAFNSYKSAIPSHVDFYADPYFIAADRAIFGTDAWLLTHAVIGPLGTVVIDRIYALWGLVVVLYLSWLCFTRNQALQLRGLLAYVLCWALLGNLGATLLSSVGPCFFADFFPGDPFASLMHGLGQVDAEHSLLAMSAMRYLLETTGEDRLASGISAMPSLHVTIAFLCFFITLEYARTIWIKALSGAFALCILGGSVHLGWHYAVDGIAGIIGAAAIWTGAGRLVNWVEARERKASEASLGTLHVNRGKAIDGLRGPAVQEWQ